MTGRILLIVGPAAGGMGSHVAGLTQDLTRRDWTVETFTTAETASRFTFGGTVHSSWPSRIVLVPGALRSLRRLFRTVDVVHAHGHQAGLLAVLTARTLRRRDRPAVVVSWHNAVLGQGLRRRVLGLAEAVQARAATLITGASADLVERARALGAKDARLAEVAAARPTASRADETAADALLDSLMPSDPPAPPQSPEVTPQSPSASNRTRGPVVLTVSRIAPQKRLDVLVEAAALLSHAVPGVRWLVAGDGDPELLATLTRRTAAIGAPVNFIGARTDVPALMAAADVFALPSAWEARALVVQEAMSARLPVVATAVGGIPELTGDTALLIPPGEPGPLAEAVARLLTDRPLAADLAARARARFDELPTEDDVVTAWLARYAALLLP